MAGDCIPSRVQTGDQFAGITTPPAPPVSAPPEPEQQPARKTSWSRRNPYRATVVANSVLSGAGSAKEVRHIELTLGDSGIDYQPGDGLSVLPVNDPAAVERILERLGATGDEVIVDRRSERTLREALTSHYEISTASKYLVDYVATRSGDAELTAAEVRRVAAKGCHAITFSENPAVLGWPSRPSRAPRRPGDAANAS